MACLLSVMTWFGPRTLFTDRSKDTKYICIYYLDNLNSILTEQPLRCFFRIARVWDKCGYVHTHLYPVVFLLKLIRAKNQKSAQVEELSDGGRLEIF